MRYPRLAAYPMMVLLLVMICVVSCPIQTVSSQTATIVKVEPSTVSAHVGESFNVTVSLSNVQNLYGLEVLLNWNPDVLRATIVDIRLGVETFSDGVLHESSNSPSIFIAENNLTQTEGVYRLVATSMAPALSFSGSGNMVKIIFEPTKVGNSALDLESQLFDYPPVDRVPRISLPIEHLTQDSYVTVKASTEPEPPPPDKTPPEIKVLSPVNQTYDESSVSLVFTVNELFNWTGYSLDGKENVTVTGNVTLTGLSNSLHNVTVYANDTSGNMGASSAINFLVAVPEPEPSPIILIGAAVAVVVVAASAGLLVYFKKRRRQHAHFGVYVSGKIV